MKYFDLTYEYETAYSGLFNTDHELIYAHNEDEVRRIFHSLMLIRGYPEEDISVVMICELEY